MKINSVQAAQPSFGTKIKADPRTIHNLNTAYHDKYFRRFVNDLENNGQDDVFVITPGPSDAWGNFTYNAFLYDIKYSNNKNGFDSYLMSDVFEFDMYRYNVKEKNIWDRPVKNIEDVYNLCRNGLSKKDYRSRCKHDTFREFMIY